MKADKDKHIYKPQAHDLSKLFKKASFILAVITFVAAVFVASYFDRFFAKPGVENLGPGSRLAQFESPEEFTDFIGVPTLANATGEIAKSEVKNTNTNLVQDNIAYFNLADAGLVRVDASTPEEPQITTIPTSTGAIEVFETRVISIGDNRIEAIEPNTKRLVWSMEFNENKVLDYYAKKQDGFLYLAVNSQLKTSINCPLYFATQAGKEITTPCNLIYFPQNSSKPYTSVTTIIKINPVNGGISDRVSFVSNSETSISLGDTMLVSFETGLSTSREIYNFFATEAIEILPADIVTDLQELDALDLSPEAKLAELNHKIKLYKEELPGDLKQKFQDELDEKLRSSNVSPQSAKSLLVSINSNNLSVIAETSVNGVFEVGALSSVENQIFAIKSIKKVSSIVESSFMYGDNNFENLEEIKLDEVSRELEVLNEKYQIVHGKENTYLIRLNNEDVEEIASSNSITQPLSDSQLLTISETSTGTRVRLINIDNPDSAPTFVLNESYRDITENIQSFSSDGEASFFLASNDRGFAFAYGVDNIGILRILPLQNINASVFINNYLYALNEEELAVLDVNSRIVITSEPLVLEN